MYYKIWYSLVMKRCILFIAMALTLSSCSDNEPSLTEQDIYRTCAKVGSTPNYLAASVFVDELHNLDDKSGKTTTISSDTEYYFEQIAYRLESGQSKSWHEACEKILRMVYLGIYDDEGVGIYDD